MEFFDQRWPNPWVYGLYDQVNSDLQGGLCEGPLPGLLLPVPVSPQWVTSDPHVHSCVCVVYASVADIPTLAGMSGSVFCGVTELFSPGFWCTQIFFCPPKVKSLPPPVLWKPYNQIPLAFKVRFPGDSQSLCQIPKLGSLTWGSEPSQ